MASVIGWQGPEIEQDKVREDIRQLLKLAKELCPTDTFHHGDRSVRHEIPDALDKLGMKLAFGQIGVPDYIDMEDHELPRWVRHVPPATAVLIWLIGLLVTRKTMHRWMATGTVDSVPTV